MENKKLLTGNFEGPGLNGRVTDERIMLNSITEKQVNTGWTDMAQNRLH
jgi:hypothetical protein